MIKKIVMTIAISIAIIWAADYDKAEKKSASIKIQTRVGEVAINNVIMSYFAGKHEIPVDGLGNITLVVKSMGIDIQGEDKIAFGYDMTITSDFLSEISNISNGLIKGEIPFKDVIIVRESSLNDAYVTVMSIGKTLDAIFSLAGITNNSITSTIKKFFSNIDGEIELWKQEYGVLLNSYVSKSEQLLDISVKNVEMSYSIGKVEDNVEINIKMDLESEKQYFWIDGEYSDNENMTFNSNKEFWGRESKLLYGVKTGHPPIEVFRSIECENIPAGKIFSFNIKDACGDKPQRLISSMKTNFRVQTKHGGILIIRRNLK